MHSSKKELGQRIHEIRKKLGLNQSEFGARIGGFQKNAVSSYEIGDSSPKPETLVKIAELGDITLDWLLTGNDSPSIHTKITKESSPINGTTKKDSRNLTQLIALALDILQSDTIYKEALSMQIQALHYGLEHTKTSPKDQAKDIEKDSA